MQYNLDGFNLVDGLKKSLNAENYKTFSSVSFETTVQETPKRDLPSVTKILNVTMSEKSRLILENWKKGMIKKLGEDGFNKYTKGIVQFLSMIHIFEVKICYCFTCRYLMFM